MKRFLFLTFVASALLSCNNQEVVDVENPTGENTVTLSVRQAPSNTRGVSDQKGDNEYAVIGSAKIYFINSSGNSIYQRELTTAEIGQIANSVSTSSGAGTVTITGVPNTAIKLYFMANIKTSAGTVYPQVDGTTSADARLRIDKLQADAIHVPLSGLSDTFSPTTGSQYKASVLLTPIVARLELGQITCQNQNGASADHVNADIESYNLSGVFLNNLYEYVLLSGEPYLVGSPIDIRAQVGWSTGWENFFMSSNTAFPYYLGGVPSAPQDWNANSMVTYCATGSNPAVSFYPDPINGATSTDPGAVPKKVWGYQIVPSKTVGVGQPADVPHLILKLVNVTYHDNPLGEDTKYVTITKYKDQSDNPILEFKRGNVYRINNLIFSHNDATNQPYEQNISVTATVTVAPWVINNINPDWN